MAICRSKRGKLSLLRGATSAPGQAALNIAANAGTNVIATTRNKARFEKLLGLGAQKVEIESPGLCNLLPEAKKVDVVRDPAGISTLLDSNCHSTSAWGASAGPVGWGGLEPVQDFNPLLKIASGIHFSLFGSFVFGTQEFPYQKFRSRRL